MRITPYFNPFDKINNEAKDKFKKLSTGHKGAVVVSTALAAIVGLPLFLVGSTATGGLAFRRVVNFTHHRQLNRSARPLIKFINKIDLKSSDDIPQVVDDYIKKLDEVNRKSNLKLKLDDPQKIKNEILKIVNSVSDDKDLKNQSALLKFTLLSMTTRIVEKELKVSKIDAVGKNSVRSKKA